VATSGGEETNIGAAGGSYKHCYCLSVWLSGRVCPFYFLLADWTVSAGLKCAR